MKGGDCCKAGEQQCRQDGDAEVGCALPRADADRCSFSFLLLVSCLTIGYWLVEAPPVGEVAFDDRISGNIVLCVVED